MPSAPPVLPGFTHVNPLGLGGFADVFLYEQQMPRRKVAVKVLLRDVVDESVAGMFNAEADVMAQLGSHPAIVTVYEASISADGRPYIAMEYCPVAIGQRYRKESMPVPEVLRIGVKICGAIESAHQLGVLHRDIKPSNVMITSFGAPVLADFGIASSLAGNSSVMALSVPWSAPEVVADQSPGSIASEVWSIGATVYSLLAGHSPFEIPGSGRNRSEELSARVKQAKYTPIARSDVSAELQGILAQSMQGNPGRRQGSAAELGRHFQEVERRLGLPVTPLEVATRDESFAPEIDMTNAAVRAQVVRSRVDVAGSGRRRRAPNDALRPTDDVEVGSAAAGRSLSIGTAIWIGAALVTVIAALVTVLILQGG